MPIIDARLAVGLRKTGLKARNLRGALPENIRHVTTLFSQNRICHSTEVNGA
ncbi:hypothetical protein [Rhodovulum sulfidophilum]|uniref:hypothetical protein n=1 Tax=Rhodovulum sulfidophilum TaxID=35806 RepID=UPI00211646CC|nr:hypothetical protein [Rhodovulum sulfidophilum]